MIADIELSDATHISTRDNRQWHTETITWSKINMFCSISNIEEKNSFRSIANHMTVERSSQLLRVGLNKYTNIYIYIYVYMQELTFLFLSHPESNQCVSGNQRVQRDNN